MTEDELVLVNAGSGDLKYCRQYRGMYSDSGACYCSFMHFSNMMYWLDPLDEYECTMTIEYGSLTVDARSFMQVTMLSMTTGSVFKLYCDGADEIEARDTFVDSLISGFGENLCPDFQLFRKEYAVEQGFKADEFRKIKNRMVVKAYANALKKGRRCIASLYSERNEL